MDKRLKIAILVFFLFLLGFIVLMRVSEYRNMEALKSQYPNLPKSSYNYRKDGLKVWALRLILTFTIPLLFLTSRLSQRISVWATNGRGLFLSGLIYGLIFFGIIFLINLPLNYYSSFLLPHKYGLSNQTILRWLEVNLKGFAVNNVLISLFLWIPYTILFNSPKTWWLQLGLLVIPVIIFMTFITPMVIDPVFNTYTSIKDESLGIEIGKLLDKSNISDAEIYMVDKSKDTKNMNAYMTGISKSKRIVLWDNTINNLSQDEVLSITAHEIGHYVHGHIWKSIILSSIASIFIMFLIYITSNWILNLSYGTFGFKNIYNYASLPLLLLVLNLFTFLGNPLANYVSRYMEVEADRYEINLTHDRESATTAMEKLYEQSLGIPRPSKFYKLWYHTHPPLEERVEFYENEPFN